MISEQVATAIYGDQNPVGRSLIFDKDTEHPVEIVGVYKNFPQNATIRSNSIVRFIGQENAGNGNNWNYVYYIRLNARENAEQVMQAMNKKYQEFVGTGNSVPDNFSGSLRSPKPILHKASATVRRIRATARRSTP